MFVDSKEKMGKRYSQESDINTEHKEERENRVLIEAAIAISRKEKLHLKAQFLTITVN